jgi:hypothetical protein
VLRSVPYVFDLVREVLILWLGSIFRTVAIGGFGLLNGWRANQIVVLEGSVCCG